jgi:hypothetical protein
VPPVSARSELVRVQRDKSSSGDVAWKALQLAQQLNDMRHVAGGRIGSNHDLAVAASGSDEHATGFSDQCPDQRVVDRKIGPHENDVVFGPRRLIAFGPDIIHARAHEGSAESLVLCQVPQADAAAIDEDGRLRPVGYRGNGLNSGLRIGHFETIWQVGAEVLARPRCIKSLRHICDGA